MTKMDLMDLMDLMVHTDHMDLKVLITPMVHMALRELSMGQVQVLMMIQIKVHQVDHPKLKLDQNL